MKRNYKELYKYAASTFLSCIESKCAQREKYKRNPYFQLPGSINHKSVDTQELKDDVFQRNSLGNRHFLLQKSFFSADRPIDKILEHFSQPRPEESQPVPNCLSLRTHASRSLFPYHSCERMTGTIPVTYILGSNKTMRPVPLGSKQLPSRAGNTGIFFFFSFFNS